MTRSIRPADVATEADEIRKRLATIMGLATVLLQEMPAADPHAADVRQIYAAGRHAHDLLERIFAPAVWQAQD